MKKKLTWFIGLGIVIIVFVITYLCRPWAGSDSIVLGVNRGGLLGLWRTYVVKSDGSGVTRCQTPLNLWTEYAEWSPDAQWIVSSEAHGLMQLNPNIYITRRDGSYRTQATFYEKGARVPTWSPDGNYIAYIAEEADVGTGIYVLDVTCVREEVNCDFAPVFLTPGHNVDWSPDGKNIVYALYEKPWSSLESHYFIMASDGTSEPQELSPKLRGCFGPPQWSPDGSKIVLSCASVIYLFDFNSGELTPLTGSESQNDGPLWSPDGSRILFESNRDGLGHCLSLTCDSGGVRSSALYLMDTNGSNVRRVSLRDDESVQWYTWIP
ncbi:MAG: PD40 domain-containing protein [Anaerolineae bacterium]|nr:PD40 domain-containing protein [Anaerolineae bacterium]